MVALVVRLDLVFGSSQRPLFSPRFVCPHPSLLLERGLT